MEIKRVEENRDPRWLLGFICESTWLMSSTTHWEEARALEMIKIWPREFTDSMGNIWMVSGWAVGAIGFEPRVPDLRVRHAPFEENPWMSHQYCLPGVGL